MDARAALPQNCSLKKVHSVQLAENGTYVLDETTEVVGVDSTSTISSVAHWKAKFRYFATTSNLPCIPSAAFGATQTS
jgi:hypothetical protein